MTLEATHPMHLGGDQILPSTGGAPACRNLATTPHEPHKLAPRGGRWKILGYSPCNPSPIGGVTWKYLGGMEHPPLHRHAPGGGGGVTLPTHPHPHTYLGFQPHHPNIWEEGGQ